MHEAAGGERAGVTSEIGSVLHVVASARGGGAVQAAALAHGQAALGVRTALAMPADLPELEVKLLRGGPAWWRLPAATDRGAQVRAILRGLRALAPGLVHAHGARSAFSTCIALRLARPVRTPFVVSIHGFAAPFHHAPRRWLQLRVERRVAARAGAVVAAGPTERRIVLAAGLAPAARVHVLRPRLDLAWAFAIGSADRSAARAALGVAPAAFCVATACRLDRPRDLPLLLDAFADLARAVPDARLLIAGDGPDRSAIERGIASRGLAGRAFLLGHLSDVGPVLAAADVFALTSRAWEGLPTAALEAAAAGLPVVLSDAGGARDALEANESGLLVPRGDAAACARALRALAGDPERRHRMGERGRAFAAAFRDPVSMAREAQEIYAAAAAAVR